MRGDNALRDDQASLKISSDPEGAQTDGALVGNTPWSIPQQDARRSHLATFLKWTLALWREPHPPALPCPCLDRGKQTRLTEADESPGGTIMSPMTSFRMSVTVLAVMHAVFAGFTALVGAFANGGDVWQRLLVVLLHPLGAAGVLVLVLRPRLATTTILALAALLTVNVIADLGLAQLMAAGRVRGDWELALAFSVVPVIGVVYALALLRTARGTVG